MLGDSIKSEARVQSKYKLIPYCIEVRGLYDGRQNDFIQEVFLHGARVGSLPNKVPFFVANPSNGELASMLVDKAYAPVVYTIHMQKPVAGTTVLHWVKDGYRAKELARLAIPKSLDTISSKESNGLESQL